jgi:hypothetical protein
MKQQGKLRHEILLASLGCWMSPIKYLVIPHRPNTPRHQDYDLHEE